MTAQIMVLIVACVLLIRIAYDDFSTFKIRNSFVLALIALYPLYALSKGFDGWKMDLLAGGILFALGLVLWMFRLMGAGDAKLYFPIGLFVSWTHILPYTIFLIIFSTLLLLLTKFPVPLAFRHTMIGLRIIEFRAGKAVPYAVPMVLAVLAVLLPRIF